MPFTFKLSKRLALLKGVAALALLGGLVACDLTRPVESAGTKVAQLVIVPDTVTLDPSQTYQFRAYGRTQAGDSVGILTTWSATGGAIAFNGLFTAGAQDGDYRVTAFIPPLAGQAPQNHSATVRVRRRGLLVRAVVVPGSPTVVTGGTQQFAAYGLLNNGDSVAVSVIWSASSGTISPSGLYTAALTPGGDFVLATASGTSGAAIVAVTNVSVASVAVSPASATMSVGSTQQLSAVVKDAAGTVLTDRPVTWATSSSAVATVSSSGLVTGAAAGATTITATSEGKSASAAISVANLPVASVTVSPAAPNMYVAGSVQLTATPKDANGSPLTGRTVTWTTSNSAVATVAASGLVTGVAVGSATITATSEGQSGSAVVTVSTVPVASVVVTPAAANISVGGTAQLNVTLKDAAGTVLAGRPVTWTSSNPAIATVSAAGLGTGVAAGTATITATSEGKSGSGTVTVANLPVASVAVSPAAPNMHVGGSVQLTATPKDTNGSPLSGRTVTWTTSNSAVATVSASGLVTGLAVGSATITATSEGQSGSAVVTVSTVPVASVVVTPAAADVLVGGTAQLSVTLKDAAGTVLTGRAVTWTSSNPAIATVSAAGLVTGVAVGAATITATSEGKSAAATISVANVPVASVVINPVTAVVLVGASVQLTATLSDSAGNVLWGRPVTWASSAPAVATVSSTGLVTGVAASLVTITATSEGKAGSATVTVNLVPVASVTVSPASVGLPVGQTAQLSATLLDATGLPLSGRPITWTSSAPAVAVVSSGGLVTGGASGSATITATSEGKSGTATITVTSAGRSFYVSPSGNDANPCTAASPCFTMQRVSQLLSPGDIAHFASGSYSWARQRVSAGGTAGARITYISDVQWGAKIRGSCEIMRNSGDYVDIIGFDMTGTCATGLVQDGNHGRIIGNRVHDLPGTTGFAGILVDCCTFTLTGNQVISNVVDNIGPLGLDNLIHGIYVAGPNSVIANNIVTRAAAACIQTYHGATRMIISNNVVAHCGRYGIKVSADPAMATNDYTTVNNNIVVNVDGNSLYNYGIMEYPATGGNNVYNNNIVYNNSGGNVVLIGGTQSGTITLTSLQFSSLFVNYTGDASGDYHLRSGAVGIDAGTTRCAAGVSICVPLSDFGGVPRPKGAAYDIGAFEH